MRVPTSVPRPWLEDDEFALDDHEPGLFDKAIAVLVGGLKGLHSRNAVLRPAKQAKQ